MAKQKIVYVDDNGAEHSTENDADRANVRIAAEKSLQHTGIFPHGLGPLDGVNHQTLLPLQAYIDLLVRESMERTEKYGGGPR
jgi:hypothetical protein